MDDSAMMMAVNIIYCAMWIAFSLSLLFLPASCVLLLLIWSCILVFFSSLFLSSPSPASSFFPSVHFFPCPLLACCRTWHLLWLFPYILYSSRSCFNMCKHSVQSDKKQVKQRVKYWLTRLAASCTFSKVDLAVACIFFFFFSVAICRANVYCMRREREREPTGKQVSSSTCTSCLCVYLCPELVMKWEWSRLEKSRLMRSCTKRRRKENWREEKHTLSMHVSLWLRVCVKVCVLE